MSDEKFRKDKAPDRDLELHLDKKTNLTIPEDEPIPDSEGTDAKVDRLERMLSRLAMMMVDNQVEPRSKPVSSTPQQESQLLQPPPGKQQDRLRVRRSGLFSPTVEVYDSSEESDGYYRAKPGVKPSSQNSLIGGQQGRNQQVHSDGENSLYDNYSEYSYDAELRSDRE